MRIKQVNREEGMLNHIIAQITNYECNFMIVIE